MGGGLFMTTRDLARVGYLVLRNGRWKDALGQWLFILDHIVPAMR
jgi:CubicO group peptidase (beta-lactamase class C family)